MFFEAVSFGTFLLGFVIVIVNYILLLRSKTFYSDQIAQDWINGGIFLMVIAFIIYVVNKVLTWGL